MQSTGKGLVNIRNQCARATGSAVVAVLVVLGLVGAIPSRAQAQPQAQGPTATAPVFEYEVSTIKPFKPGTGEGPGVFRIGLMFTTDGFTASGVNLQLLLQQAYGVQAYQISGSPEWTNSDRFEIDAKMEASVAEAFLKSARMIEMLCGNRCFKNCWRTGSSWRSTKILKSSRCTDW